MKAYIQHLSKGFSNIIRNFKDKLKIAVKHNDGIKFPNSPKISGKSLDNASVPQFQIGNTELPRVALSDFWKNLSLRRMIFIHKNCMISREQLEKEDNVTWFGDKGELTKDEHKIKNNIFCAGCRTLEDISVNEAIDNGFILPKNLDEKLKENQNLKIRPLMINCYGVGSSDTLKQLKAGIKNGLSRDIEEVHVATAIIESLVEAKQKECKDENVIVVPYITGHSLGGMFAAAISSKLHIGSCLFNPFGLGSKLREFVGGKNLDAAKRDQDINNNGDFVNNHLVFSTEYDFTSSKTSPIKQLVKIPGKIISMKNEELKADFLKDLNIGFLKSLVDLFSIHPVETHTAYRQVFETQIEKLQNEELKKIMNEQSV